MAILHTRRSTGPVRQITIQSGHKESELSQKRGGLTGTSQCWWGFAPELLALQADGLGHHEGRGREVVGGGLLLMGTVDVTRDKEGDFPDLLTKQNQRW